MEWAGAGRAVVIAADGLNVNPLGGYGNEWVRTPHLDRLCAEGVTFDWHYADNPDPGAARRSWQTGRYHLPGGTPSPPAPGCPELFALLRASGVEVRRLRQEDVREGFGGAVTAALGELGGADRWLLWVDTDRLLPPWAADPELFEAYLEVPEEEIGDDEILPWEDPPVGPIDRDDLLSWDRLHATFAAAVSGFDADLGEVFDLLRGRGLDRDALWVVTASGGYPLGEHGYVGPHRPWVHDEAVHVPLILRLPGAAEAGRRVAGLTQGVDLMPTLLEAFGVPAPDSAQGSSLLPLARGAAEAVREYACYGWQIGPAAEWGLRTPGWAFLLPVSPHPDDPPRKPRLYAKPDDRWEVNDLRQKHLDFADRLEQTLRDFVSAAAGAATFRPPPLPEERETESNEGGSDDDQADRADGG